MPRQTWLHLAQGSSPSLQKPQLPHPSTGSRSLPANSTLSSACLGQGCQYADFPLVLPTS